MKRMVSLILLSTVIPAVAYAAHAPLSIQTNGGCPVHVISTDRSCDPGRADPLDVACRSNNGAVVFRTTGNPIVSIAQKSGSPGALSCSGGGMTTSCRVSGQPGQKVMYNVTLKDCRTLDPTIIIR